MKPIRALPLSTTCAGVMRQGGKAGLMNPIRTLPPSLMAGGFGITLSVWFPFKETSYE